VQTDWCRHEVEVPEFELPEGLAENRLHHLLQNFTVDVGTEASSRSGGILRDIQESHSLHLTELHRFTDPAEAAASLVLRDGDPEALNFYLDHGRVYVGDLATATRDAFAAWVSDRAAGLDTIMLASTRKLVNELNRQARDHLLGSHAAAARCAWRMGARPVSAM
jgi:AAA domain